MVRVLQLGNSSESSSSRFSAVDASQSGCCFRMVQEIQLDMVLDKCSPKVLDVGMLLGLLVLGLLWGGNGG